MRKSERTFIMYDKKAHENMHFPLSFSLNFSTFFLLISRFCVVMGEERRKGSEKKNFLDVLSECSSGNSSISIYIYFFIKFSHTKKLLEKSIFIKIKKDKSSKKFFVILLREDEKHFKE